MNDDDVMLDLFMHPGWKRFQSEMAESLETLKLSCFACKASDDFFRQKGMIEMLSNIVGYDDAFRRSMDMEADKPSEWHIMQ